MSIAVVVALLLLLLPPTSARHGSGFCGQHAQLLLLGLHKSGTTWLEVLVDALLHARWCARTGTNECK